MSEESKRGSIADASLDAANLYREENITDLRVGSIQRLVPVNIDGTDDDSRDIRYVAQAQIMTQMGPLPINSPIEAQSLEEAVQKYPEALQVEVERLKDMAQKQQIADAGRAGIPGMGGGMPQQGGGSNIIV